jgi:hypothetical protein
VVQEVSQPVVHQNVLHVLLVDILLIERVVLLVIQVKYNQILGKYHVQYAPKAPMKQTHNFALIAVLVRMLQALVIHHVHHVQLVNHKRTQEQQDVIHVLLVSMLESIANVQTVYQDAIVHQVLRHVLIAVLVRMQLTVVP